MNNYMVSEGTTVIGNRVIINGEELPPCPAKGYTSAIIDGKVYIDGYEFKRGKWRRTLKALWHRFF